MSRFFWFTAGYVLLASGICWYFARVVDANRKHDAMIEREERKIRDDVRAMRSWYAEQSSRKDSEIVDAFLASIEQK